jgi:hypothetical protein
MKKLILTSIILLQSVYNYAQWSNNPAINNAICSAIYTQSDVDLTTDGGGGAIITWNDSRTNFTEDIYAQRIDVNGNLSWVLNGVPICTQANYQIYPKIASDGVGGAIITWADNRNGIDLDIYAQRIDANGSPLWAYNGIPVCTAAGDQTFPEIITGSSGEAIIIWKDSRNGLNEIYSQRLNTLGNVQWTVNGNLLCSGVPSYASLAILSDGNHGAFVSWEASSDIFAQYIDSSGYHKWSSTGLTVCNASNIQESPSITLDGNYGVIVTWSDGRYAYSDIFAQKIDSSGAVQWQNNGVIVCIPSFDQEKPEIISDGIGGAIIAWEDYRNGGSYGDIYAQRINSNGIPQWTNNGVSICVAPNGQWKLNLISDGTNGSIISWTDSRNGIGSNNYDIYAQRVNSNGNIMWTNNGIVVSNANDEQFEQKIISDANGGAILAWKDSRNSSSNVDVYAQRIYNTGSLTNIDQTLNSFKFNISPNPNNGNLFIEIIDNIEDESKLTISNIIGEKLQEYVLKIGKNEINLNQASGIYFLTIFNKSGVNTTKIVIQ